MTDHSHFPAAELWRPFHFFLGHWRGTGKGRPGISKVSRTYNLILQNRFLQVLHRSEYPPQDRNPEGEIHEELGLFSFDVERNKYVFREFHVEGFIFQYGLQDDPAADLLVFVSEAMENFTPGWQARTTIRILNDDEFWETFDLAGPSQSWTTLITSKFMRVEIPGS